MINYKQLSTKKLNALLDIVSDEDRKQIEEILSARALKQKDEEVADEEVADEEVADEEVADEEVADEEVADEEVADESTKAKKIRRTADETDEALQEAREQQLYHFVSVMPAGSTEWVEGTIIGCIAERKTGKILYRIELSDQKKVITKMEGSAGLLIKEDINEERKALRRSLSHDRGPWSQEDMTASALEAKSLVGKLVDFDDQKTNSTIPGRIVGFVLEKRIHKVLLRIAYTDAENNVKYSHKVMGSSNYTLNEGFDAEGLSMQEKEQNKEFIIREHSRRTKEEKAKILEERIAKAQAQIEALQEKIEKWQNDYATLSEPEETKVEFLENSEDCAQNSSEDLM